MSNKFFKKISIIAISSFFLSYASLGMDPPQAKFNFTQKSLNEEKDNFADIFNQLNDLMANGGIDYPDAVKQLLDIHFPSKTQPELNPNFYRCLRTTCNCLKSERDEYIRKIMERTWVDLSKATPKDIATALTQAQVNLLMDIDLADAGAYAADPFNKETKVNKVLQNWENTISFIKFTIANNMKKNFPFFIDVFKELRKWKNSAGMAILYTAFLEFDEVYDQHLNANDISTYKELMKLFTSLKKKAHVFESTPNIIQYDVLIKKLDIKTASERKMGKWSVSSRLITALDNIVDYKLGADEELTRLFQEMPEIDKYDIIKGLWKAENCYNNAERGLSTNKVTFKDIEEWNYADLANYLHANGVSLKACHRTMNAGLWYGKEIVQFLKALSKTEAVVVMTALLEKQEVAEKIVHYAKKEYGLEVFCPSPSLSPEKETTSSSDSSACSARPNTPRKTVNPPLRLTPPEEPVPDSTRVAHRKRSEEDGGSSRNKRSRTPSVKSVLADLERSPTKKEAKRNSVGAKPPSPRRKSNIASHRPTNELLDSTENDVPPPEPNNNDIFGSFKETDKFGSLKDQTVTVNFKNRSLSTFGYEDCFYAPGSSPVQTEGKDK